MTQKEALTILKTGANVFLTGEPGAGKTHTINRYVAYLKSHGIEPAVTASTGIAATHISGITIHSWSGIGIAKELATHEINRIADKSSAKGRIKKTKVLIIDEISMLDANTLTLVDTVCRAIKKNASPFGGMQIVLTGDFFQLPPITRTGEETQFAFNSNAWQELDPTICYITEQHRQDDHKFLTILSAIRRDDFQEEHHAHIQGCLVQNDNLPLGVTKLFSHNADVDTINSRELEKLNEGLRTFSMSFKGPKKIIETLKKGCISPEELSLKIGAVVMFTKNNPTTGFVNGTLGKVVSFNKENGLPVVKTRSGKLITAEPMDWSIEENGFVLAKITQIPLRLAWAITIHKSQGMSLDAALIDLRSVFEYGQGYVALSRVRSLEGLHLLGYNEQSLLVHPEIIKEDQIFRSASRAAIKDFSELTENKLQEKFNEFIVVCGGNLKESSSKPKVKKEKNSTYNQTLDLLKKGKAVSEIAKLRGFSLQTILGHLEKLIDQNKIKPNDILPLLSLRLNDALPEIHATFKRLETTKLTPVFESFHGKYSFNDLRLARMTLGIDK